MKEHDDNQYVMPTDLTDEAREARMISMATDLAYKKLADGTASNQLILHYLDLGSTKTRIEKDILRNKADLLNEQTDAIRKGKASEIEYNKLLDVLVRYQGGSIKE